MMKTLSVNFVKYALVWFLIFVVARLAFVIYQGQYNDLSIKLLAGIVVNGGRLDLSITGYIMAVASFIFVFSTLFSGKIISNILRIYTLLVLIPVVMILSGDMILYKHWGNRIDIHSFVYVDSPGVIFRSHSLFQILVALIAVVAEIAFLYVIFNKFVFKTVSLTEKSKWFAAPYWIFITGLMLIPIRGGFGIAPINTGAAYFSKNIYANQIAVNPVFNLGYSLKSYKKMVKPYAFMGNEKAEQIFNRLMSVEPNVQVLNTEKPNVVIILLESFSAKAIGRLGGVKGITPNLEAIGKEGLWFSNFYATGVRSEMGLVGVIGGYPTQPTLSVMKFPQKTKSLPSLPDVLKRYGYNSTFYYGGDINFANMKSYITLAEFDNVVSMNDFSDSLYNSKWGVHDEIMFNALLDGINKSEQPFLKFLFTLSSHEPFDVPMETVVKDNPYLNSVYYTDQCIGRFWSKAKEQPWFDNTLFIFVADHGVRIIDNLSNSNPERYHIPMVWSGGALSVKDSVIPTYGSQTDIASTLLQQLNIDHTEFRFSKNILTNPLSGFAFFDYNDGFGFIDEKQIQTYDNIKESFIVADGLENKTDSLKGKAYLQVMYNDYISR